MPGPPLAFLPRRTEATEKRHVVSIETAIAARRDPRAPRRLFGLEDRQPLPASAAFVAQGFDFSRRGDQRLGRAVGSSVDFVAVCLKHRPQIRPNERADEFLVGDDYRPDPPAVRPYGGFGWKRQIHPSILALQPGVGRPSLTTARAGLPQQLLNRVFDRGRRPTVEGVRPAGGDAASHAHPSPGPRSCLGSQAGVSSYTPQTL